MNEHKNIITIEDEIKEFSDKPVKSSALFKALEEKGLPDASEANVGDVLTKGEGGIGWSAPSGGGGGRVVKCTGTATAVGNAIIIPLDISPEEFLAVFTAATASPLYILLPRITEVSPYYSYDNDGYPDWLGMYLIDGYATDYGVFKINDSQEYVVGNTRVSNLAVEFPDSPDDPMVLFIPGDK